MGPEGAEGPVGPKGDTGTVDTVALTDAIDTNNKVTTAYNNANNALNQANKIPVTSIYYLGASDSANYSLNYFNTSNMKVMHQPSNAGMTFVGNGFRANTSGVADISMNLYSATGTCYIRGYYRVNGSNVGYVFKYVYGGGANTLNFVHPFQAGQIFTFVNSNSSCSVRGSSFYNRIVVKYTKS